MDEFYMDNLNIGDLIVSRRNIGKHKDIFGIIYKEVIEKKYICYEVWWFDNGISTKVLKESAILMRMRQNYLKFYENNSSSNR